MTDPLVDAFARLAGGEGDELTAALLVNRWLLPELDTQSVHRQLDELSQYPPTQAMPWKQLAQVGFQGNRDDYAALENSRLDWVLANRRGIPITLAVILIQVARTRGHSASGVNFPGHFLVQVDATLVDPFQMEPTDPDRRLADLTRQQPDLKPPALLALKQRAFATAGPVAIALRMLNNLKLRRFQERALTDVLSLLDLQLALQPEEAGLLLEQGECWLGMGAERAAAASFERALAVAGDDAVRERIRTRLTGLNPGRETLH